MTTPVKTGKVTGRRQLHFNSIEDIVADVEQLAKWKEIRSLGNWSPGQILKHLTIVMNGSVDGVPRMMSGFKQFMIRLLFKNKFLKSPMPPGFELPASASALLPPPTSLEEGLDGFRRAAKRLQTETQRHAHPALGPLTAEEWNQLHCRHSELHLSFLVPG